MIDRTKFDNLTEEEKRFLGETIGLPTYYEELNRCWWRSSSVSPEEHMNKIVEIISKLL